PLRMGAQRVDRAFRRVELDHIARKRGPRQLEPDVGRCLDLLVAGVLGDEDAKLTEPELFLRPLRERHMTAVRRVERSAVQADAPPRPNPPPPPPPAAPPLAPPPPPAP